jgi:hypothetical protein
MVVRRAEHARVAGENLRKREEAHAVVMYVGDKELQAKYVADDEIF